ncbi:hypothetical protein DID88_000606 [Monilinia fructigena]|uniref:Uncharacterized protein n=1 Tax=Monilinia fructigena TaxID=38457 RepID=A0A395IIB6_9HELO|nr:hypothetical protein DID88_000606 [Monilinia fructigena]
MHRLVRDYLSGKMSVTGGPPPHRPLAHQAMAHTLNLANFVPALPSRVVPGPRDQTLTDPAAQKSQELALEHTTKLIDLWFLADKVLMPELQNAAIIAIDALRFFTPLQGLPVDICISIYAKTPAGSPLRKYLADTTLRRLHPNAEDQGEDFPVGYVGRYLQSGQGCGF